MEKELILKAKECKSAEEIMALAKENGYELTEEQAKEYFEKLNANGEIADDELDNVAGGCGEEEVRYCPKCGGRLHRINGGPYFCARCNPF